MDDDSHFAPNRYAARATAWHLRTRILRFGRLPLLMGIVNVTPDSFSDGGQFVDAKAAVDHALRLLDDGADILDIGGESTRPYSTPISAEEELARVLPVIREVNRLRPEAILSIDTSKALVAEAAVGAGAEIINDVTGFVGGPAVPAGRDLPNDVDAKVMSDGDQRTTLAVALQTGVGICAMHMQGTPQTMQDNPFYDDVVEDIYMYLCQRRDALLAAGIARERICLDPGIGFGKTHEHNLTLMSSCGRFHDLGCPLLVGHSRKGFIGKVVARDSVAGKPSRSDGLHDRTAGTVGGALALARQGVQVLRVHDVRQVREALLLFEACGGLD